MNEILQVVLIIIVILLMTQVSNIIHELGHAIPALLFSRDKVTIVVGRNNEKIVKFKIKRLTFIFRGYNFIFSATDYKTIYMKPKQQIATFAGGPVISFIFGESLSLIGRSITNDIVKNIVIIIAYYFIFQFVATIIPVIYPKWFLGYGGYPSDGYKISTVIKNNRRH
ncbi:MAG: hypothetical protein AB6733_14455 [Clostridiaceae bacterium]